jgi:uncharacterized protein YbaP (TraB family)
MKKAYLAGVSTGAHVSMSIARQERISPSSSTAVHLMRNKRMVARWAAPAGRHLRRVGALHLSGEEGILRLLQKRGFTVKRAY